MESPRCAATIRYAYMRDGDGDGIVCEAGGGEAKGGTARQGSAPAPAVARSDSTTTTDGSHHLR